MKCQLCNTVKVVYSGFGYSGISFITVKFPGPEISVYLLYIKNFGYNGFVYSGISFLTVKSRFF